MAGSQTARKGSKGIDRVYSITGCLKICDLGLGRAEVYDYGEDRKKNGNKNKENNDQEQEFVEIVSEIEKLISNEDF